ncbi:MAG: histidinol-phosphate transaminase [Clostridia bacterium]|nr:histidinol-phosphate transaminase [Clostridia bacterium]
MQKIEQKVFDLIRPDIQALKAYHVPDASGLIKLDAMENPYTWPEAVRLEWLQALGQVALNRYPDPDAGILRQRLQVALRVPAGMELMLGNGSDELIQVILMAISRPGAVVLAPTPTFVMYEMIATFIGMKFVGVPLKQDFSLDMPAMLRAIDRHRPAAIFLAYPNNPTGNLFARADIEGLIQHTPGLMVLDEAYHAFAGHSFMDHLGQRDNLLVMRTLSKQGLAGLRLGALAGPAPWLKEFNKVRLPYNIGTLTQASAEFALTHLDLLDEQARQIRRDREKLLQALADMPGVYVWPSLTNFILFRTEKRDADEVFEGLRSRGVLIKNLNPSGGMLTGCLRVTVGTPEENIAFLKALETVV